MALGLVDNELPNVATIGGKASKGDQITLAGYGCTSPQGTGGNDGILRVGDNRITTFTAFDMVSSEIGGSALCFGDSGGPAFVFNSKKVLGVNSKGNIKDTNYNTRTDLAESRQFFDDWSKKNDARLCVEQSPAPIPDLCYKADAVACKIEAEITALVNEFRVKNRKTPLKFHGGISFVAREWSKEQSARGMISHKGFPDARSSAYSKEFGSKFNPRAENVAMNFVNEKEAAKALFDLWVNSAGHRKNMLGDFDLLGVGVHFLDGAVYATQIFGDN